MHPPAGQPRGDRDPFTGIAASPAGIVADAPCAPPTRPGMSAARSLSGGGPRRSRRGRRQESLAGVSGEPAFCSGASGADASWEGALASGAGLWITERPPRASRPPARRPRSRRACPSSCPSCRPCRRRPRSRASLPKNLANGLLVPAPSDCLLIWRRSTRSPRSRPVATTAGSSAHPPGRRRCRSGRRGCRARRRDATHAGLALLALAAPSAAATPPRGARVGAGRPAC